MWMRFTKRRRVEGRVFVVLTMLVCVGASGRWNITWADHIQPVPPTVYPYNADLHTGNQSMWGPGNTPGAAGQVFDLVDLSWNESGSARAVQHISLPDSCVSASVVDAVCEAACRTAQGACYAGCAFCACCCCDDCDDVYNGCKNDCTNTLTICVSDFLPLSGDFGAGVEGATSGDIGAFLDLTDLGKGTVNVDYPVHVDISGPTQDSFRGGDTVRISTVWALRPGQSLATDSPDDGSIDLVGKFGLTASAGAEVCVFSCLDFPFFPSIDFTDGGQPFAGTILSLEGGNIDPITGFLTGLSGNWGLPNVDTTSVAVGKKLVAKGTDHFVDLSLDLDKWVVKILSVGLDKFLPPLGLGPFNLGIAQVGYEIIDVELTFDMFQDQTFEFDPTVQVKLQFPQAVHFTINHSGGGHTVGFAALVTMDAGESVDVVAPEAVIDVNPKFAIKDEANFSNETTTTFSQSIELTILELTLVLPSFPIIPSNSLCIPGTDICIPGLSFPGVNLGTLGPLFEDSFPLYSIIDTDNFDGDRPPWSLQGFNSPTGGPFPLDPEFPPVAVITALSDVLEGAVAAYSAANSTDADNDPLVFTWDFGDGTPTVVGEVVNHIYADNGLYLITLTADDGHEQTTDATWTVTVHDVAPTVTALAGPPLALLDEPITIDGAFLDPGFDHPPSATQENFTALVDWGDGSPEELIDLVEVPGDRGVDTTGTCQGGHVYTVPQFYTITLRVIDDEGLEGVATINILIKAPGSFTGGGQVNVSPAQILRKTYATHDFELCYSAENAFGGMLKYQDPRTRDKFRATTFTSIIFIDDPLINPKHPAARFDKAIVEGVGTLNKTPGVRFRAVLTDAGEPGSSDRFEIQFPDGQNAGVPDKALSGGNHQAHPPQKNNDGGICAR